MSQYGEDVMVNDAALVDSIQGPCECNTSKMRMTGLLRARSISPHPHYSPYGVCTQPTKTGASRVQRPCQPMATQSLHGELEEICSQLSVVTESLSSHVKQTS